MKMLRKVGYSIKVGMAFMRIVKYAIKRGYLHRNKVIPFIDEANADEYQKEVYAAA